jgi:hypothetical protein
MLNLQKIRTNKDFHFPGWINSIFPGYRLLFLIFTGFIIFSSTLAQNRQSAHSVKTEERITIDGILDEKDWKRVDPITNFVQFAPNTGNKATRQTEVRVLFGNDDLYIGVILFDNPDDLKRTLGRRDEYNHADWFFISIDSYFNRRSAYTFGINIAGVQLDGQLNKTLAEDGTLLSGVDMSWNAVWFSSVKITEGGWLAEIRIPYSMLRFSKTENQTWGIHFTRRTARLGEISEWPFIPLSERSNLVAQFGHLTNIKNMDPKREFQVRPYILSQLQSKEDMNNPGNPEYNSNFDIGGDIKLGLGPNVMLDATINPDFGQVESDPAVLNLTAFETRLDENRPFFLEGADIYKFGIGQSQVFHSRRIGAKSPILGATKVSGRSPAGLSFGLLGAATGKNLDSPNLYGVGRLRQQIGHYSSAGAVLTNYYSPVHYEGWQTSTGGIDWDFRFNNNIYGFEGITAFASRNSLIPERTDEKGYMWGIVLRKRQGSFTGHLTFLGFSEDYNPNDLGWTTNERDFRNIWINTTYIINDGKAFGPFQRASINTYNTQRVSYVDWINTGDRNRIGVELVTKKFQTIRFNGMFEDMFGGYDLFETRGLGNWARPSSITLTGEYVSDSRRNRNFSQKGVLAILGNGGRKYTVESNNRIDLGTAFSFSGIIKFNLEKGVLAWMANESFLMGDNGIRAIGKNSLGPQLMPPAEYVEFDDMGLLEPALSGIEPQSPGLYYAPVFGERDTRSVDLTIRSSVTFTKNLSFQIYNQLFLAKGKYENYQILQNPDKLAPFYSYPKMADFALNSYQVNMVLRWEYSAGSTFFLIWTHGRNEKDLINPLAPREPSPYHRSLDDQIVNTFNIFPQNALILKLDYTFLN